MPSSSLKRKHHFLFSASLFLTDGVFGRCQKVPVTDVYHYEVSPGAQQRLRAALLQLSRGGRQEWSQGAPGAAVPTALSAQ